MLYLSSEQPACGQGLKGLGEHPGSPCIIDGKANPCREKGLAQGHGFESGPEVSVPDSKSLRGSACWPAGLLLHAA